MHTDADQPALETSAMPTNDAMTAALDRIGEGTIADTPDDPGNAIDDATALGDSPAGTPDAYALSAPDGVTIDARALELATPVFKALNLSNEQAQTLVPVAAEWAQAIRAQGEQQMLEHVAAERKAWFESARKDAEIGGSRFDTSVSLAAKALDTLGFPKGSPFRALLDDSGLGNHPEMIRAFARVGRAVAEDGFDRPGTPSAAKKSDAELFYPGMNA